MPENNSGCPSLTKKSIEEAEITELVSCLTSMSMEKPFSERLYDLAIIGINRLVKEREHVRAATVALAFEMPLFAQELVIEGFEAHPEGDPYNPALVEVGRLVLLKLEQQEG